ncbi:hypothetical protein [Pseudomonas sp. 50_B]|uniref:hypothetical protein n=1 Tax=Pseudomonas sp. 50_B TaxID=2813574 RepID=UPI001A9FFCC5|nr:hypothetical protein [Pseudomonas sp. 50_B]
MRDHLVALNVDHVDDETHLSFPPFQRARRGAVDEADRGRRDDQRHAESGRRAAQRLHGQAVEQVGDVRQLRGHAVDVELLQRRQDVSPDAARDRLDDQFVLLNGASPRVAAAARRCG